MHFHLDLLKGMLIAYVTINRKVNNKPNTVKELWWHICCITCQIIIVCLFDWGLSSHSRIVHSYGDVSIIVKRCKFDLCSALMAIEQWGFFSVPHLLLHGASVYNGYLREPVKLTTIAERLAVELSLPVFTTYRSVAAGIQTTNLPLAGPSQIITLPCQIIMLSCQIFMLTCQILILSCHLFIC